MFPKNFKLSDFHVNSVCFLQNFFFRSEQRFPSILYHCAKFQQFSPSTFRDIFDRNLNFPKISRVQDRYSRMHEPGALAHATYSLSSCVASAVIQWQCSVAQATRAKKLFWATLTGLWGAFLCHNINLSSCRYTCRIHRVLHLLCRSRLGQGFYILALLLFLKLKCQQSDPIKSRMKLRNTAYYSIQYK